MLKYGKIKIYTDDLNGHHRFFLEMLNTLRSMDNLLSKRHMCPFYVFLKLNCFIFTYQSCLSSGIKRHWGGETQQPCCHHLEMVRSKHFKHLFWFRSLQFAASSIYQFTCYRWWFPGPGTFAYPTGGYEYAFFQCLNFCILDIWSD